MKLHAKETQIQKAILDYLTYKGIFHWRQNTQGIPLHGKHAGKFRPSPMRGVPDIIAIHKKVCVGIEVKSSKGKQNDYQKIFQANMENAGGLYVIARSLDDVMNLFE